MIIKSYKKLDIALRQIETALELHLGDKDPFSVITLAGAGEEILGKELEKGDKQNSFDQRVNALVEISHVYNQDGITQKKAKDILNNAKNSIKHMDINDDDDHIDLDPSNEAVDMLYRAIENYYSLTGLLTPNMGVFLRGGYATKFKRTY